MTEVEADGISQFCAVEFVHQKSLFGPKNLTVPRIRSGKTASAGSAGER